MVGVTKAALGLPEIARELVRAGVTRIGDSRIENIETMRRAGLTCEFTLIRSPMISQADRVVAHADISHNTEIEVVERLSTCARQQGRSHGVLLMVELGDLREGILPGDVESVVREVIGLAGIELIGIGTNLACLGGVRPTETNMRKLSSIVGGIRRMFGISLEVVSGGNSANYQWFISTPDVGLVNHLRVGEGILLGCDTLTREPIPGLYADAFTLVAEVIELKTKPSRPYGEIAQDAFGHVPAFEDNGNVLRAILSLGRQDVDVSVIRPGIEADILGASSDHLILDVRDPDLGIGDEVRFDIGYGALLRAMTSPYVEKEYLPRFHRMTRRPHCVDHLRCRAA